MMLGIYWDNGKQNGNYCGLLRLYWENAKSMEATICASELSPQKPELAKKNTPSMSIPKLKPLEFRVLGFRV